MGNKAPKAPLYHASERGELMEVEELLDSGADVNWEDEVYYIRLYYTVIYTVVIDIIIYYSGDRHLFTKPVWRAIYQYVTFSSTGELISIKLMRYVIYYIIIIMQ